jgi:small subunit ribosomal protein S8
MSMTDPIADYLTRIRNATMVRHNKVDVPASNMAKSLTKILMDEGYIQNFTPIEDSKQGILRIYLKYGDNKKSAISGLDRLSTPGLRRYTRVEKIPKVLNGMGIAILSTSKGILTDKQARKEKVGGELICTVW